MPATSSRQAAQTTNSPVQTEARSGEPQSATGADQALQASQRPAAPASGAVGDVLKMLDAGVSPEVIKVFVENSSVAVNLSAADVIALKNHGATDDITTALLKRGGEARAAASAAGPVAPAPGFTGAVPDPFGNGPEGYDFFQRYYLYPRALASAYQQLGYYSLPPYGYGYSPAFGAPFSFRYGHPRRFGFRNISPLRYLGSKTLVAFSAERVQVRP